jgi:hypothetical protein
MRVREREIKEAGLAEAEVAQAQEVFRGYGLRLQRLYRGTSRAGWYVSGIRDGGPGRAFSGRLAVDLAGAVADPQGARVRWLRRAEVDGATLDEGEAELLATTCIE